MRGRPPCLLAGLMLAACASAADYSFDAREFERKPFEFGGYLEGRAEHLRLNTDGAYYLLAHPPGERRSTLDRGAALAEVFGKYTREALTLRARGQAEAAQDQVFSRSTARWLEAAASLQPGRGTVLEAGKVALKWGTGYAFNPVGFVQRLKDPSEPEQSREGYGMALADVVRSFDGPLATLALTALVVPTEGGLNDSFGPKGHSNPAFKLYALFNDTDIDVLYAARGSRPARFGVDFARNLSSNFEVHGEWARVSGVQQPLLLADGRIVQRRLDATSWLLGLRYLTESEATWIVEFYRNGAGYTEDELALFFDAARAAGIDGAVPERLAAAALGGYARPNAGRRYVYLRVNQKDPFDLLYFTPALTVIANADDGSASLAPELSYTGVDNLELRLRYTRLVGGGQTEYGERPNRYRIDLRLRYFF